MAQVRINTQRNTWMIHTHPQSIIGKGAYGIIYKGTDDNGREIAAKSFVEDKQSKISKEDLEKLLKINHPNIVTIYDIKAAIEDASLWIFMEFCKHGDLNRFLREKHLTNIQLVDAMAQMTEGLEYLHRNNIIHRDLKPANILVKEQMPLNLKLADFDVSKFFNSDIETSVMSSNVGTLAFKAPEFFRRDKDGKLNYHRSVDIYALGLTFLAMTQRNKLLIPRIETPQGDDELHNPIGSTIANRMKYGIKDLDVVKLSDIPIPSRNHGVSFDVDASATLENNFSEDNLFYRLKRLISRMTCAIPEQRISATEVLHTLHYRIWMQVKKLTPTCEWRSAVSGISILSNDQETLTKRGKVDGHECLHIVRRTNGDIINNIEILCNHDGGLVVPDVNDSNIVMEICTVCKEVRAYNIATGERHVIYKKCSPLGVCTGPGNTLFIFDTNGCIVQLKRDSNNTRFNVVRNVRLQGSLGRAHYLYKMCYSEITSSLVIVSLYDGVVYSFCLADGSWSWTVSGKIRDFELFAYGVCCNPADGSIFICNGGRKTNILLLNPFTGCVLRVIRTHGIFRSLSDICWSSSQPHLTVLGINEDDSEDSVVCFNVELQDEVKI